MSNFNNFRNDPLAELDYILENTGHDTWGWVFYRCTYSSDNDWSEFMKELKRLSLKDFQYYGASETMVKKQIWTVIEDRDKLENASKSDVRRMFNEWVHSPEAAAEQPNAKQPVSEGYPPIPRYTYCMHVDETSLRSVLDKSRDWHVNIINRHWIPEEEESDDDEADPEDDEDFDEVCDADIWPEIEGCTEEDVGWQMASDGDLVVGYIEYCHHNHWRLYYERPSQRAESAEVLTNLSRLELDAKT
jgi:hypothetical protein